MHYPPPKCMRGGLRDSESCPPKKKKKPTKLKIYWLSKLSWTCEEFLRVPRWGEMSRFIFAFVEFWRGFVRRKRKENVWKLLEECKLMSHLLVYLKSVNYIHCKIFNSLLSCLFMCVFKDDLTGNKRAGGFKTNENRLSTCTDALISPQKHLQRQVICSTLWFAFFCLFVCFKENRTKSVLKANWMKWMSDASNCKAINNCDNGCLLDKSARTFFFFF